MPSSVQVIAPCRIHFGLLSLDSESGERQFGGVGAMLRQPSVEVLVRRAESTKISGLHTKRVQAFVQLWQVHTGIIEPVDCTVVRAPREHVGLGLGTQLGMSVAWALDSLYDRDGVRLEDRARSVCRGQRSAVGTYGFRDGGLIVESGKTSKESLGKLHERILVPDEWRVVLVRLTGASGLAGEAEISAFESLPPLAHDLQAKLRRELYDRLAPAARDGDFTTFSESVYQYGYSAGECFAASQGGPFLTSSIAEFVDFCRREGVHGVGQSSWGPTVFCWFPNQRTADQFVQKHLTKKTNFRAEVIVSAVAQHGAVRVMTDD